MTRRVVVTGLGTVNPCGLDVPSTWDAVSNGRSGTGLVTRFDASDFPSRVAGEVKGFDGDAIFGRRAARRLGLFMQYAIVAAREAMARAGFDRDAGLWPDPDRLGVYVGSGIGGFPEIVDEVGQLDREGAHRISAYFIPRSLINLATGQIAIELQARGPSLCIATACAVGNHSIGEAWRTIRTGEADVIVAGGTEAALTPLGYGGFMVMRALSRHNDDPSRASRPFDRDRDGFVMSEGAGVVVLEALDHAVARGAPILAELVGYAATTDAHHVTAPAEGGAGAARCMARALAVAGLAPADIGYINAHGTSTPANDAAETAAIRAVFGAAADRVPVSSTKGATGHLLGAAGGLEAILTICALQHGILPPTANYRTPDPECDLDVIPEGPRRATPRYALSNAFGFGGTNSSLIFQRWEA